MTGKRALILEPHNDDLIIGMGGTGLQLLNAGWDFKSIVLTDGRFGSKGLDPERTKQVRKREKEREVNDTGIDYVEFDYEDQELKAIYDDKDRREEVLNKLRDVINDFEPSVIFAPAINEGHPDHRASNRFATKLVKQCSEEITFVEYIVWDIPFFSPTPHDSNIIVAVDISKQIDEKLDVIEYHRSQLEVYNYIGMVKNFNGYLSELYQQETNSEFVELLHFEDEYLPSCISKDIDYTDVTSKFHQPDGDMRVL
jgi:LmbE family N-acetylglucosaminyl deacetylase